MCHYVERIRSSQDFILTNSCKFFPLSIVNVLMKDLRLHDHEYFFKSFRMNPTAFELLLSWIRPYIRKSLLRREVATPAEIVCVTLRHSFTWMLPDSHVNRATFLLSLQSSGISCIVRCNRQDYCVYNSTGKKCFDLFWL